MTQTDPRDLTPVREARLRQGLSLRELARRCAEEGVPASYNNLARIERGEGVPYPKLRAALARVLGLDAVHDFERKAS